MQAYNLSLADGVITVTGGDLSITYTPAIADEKHGGDDAFHPGWDKKAWKKKQEQDEALEKTIRLTYLKTLGIEPEPEEIQEIVKEVQEATVEPLEATVVDYSPLSEWLAQQETIVAQILANRQEEDDEETLLMLI